MFIGSACAQQRTRTRALNAHAHHMHTRTRMQPSCMHTQIQTADTNNRYVVFCSSPSLRDKDKEKSLKGTKSKERVSLLRTSAEKVCNGRAGEEWEEDMRKPGEGGEGEKGRGRRGRRERGENAYIFPNLRCVYGAEGRQYQQPVGVKCFWQQQQQQ